MKAQSTRGSSRKSANPSKAEGRRLLIEIMEPRLFLSATQLLIVQQPADATAGQSIGTIVVDVEDAQGNIVSGDNSTVVLAGTTLTGTTSVAATNGVATFTGLTMTQAGAQTLQATDGSLASATSNQFTISAAAASQVAFTVVPGTATLSHTMSAVSAVIEDTYGNLISNSTATIALSGTALAGTTSVAAVNGTATFSNTWINQTGSFSLTGASSGLASGTSSAIVVSPTAWTKTTVLNLNSSTQGRLSASAPVMDANGNLYGITPSGGANGAGAVYKITPGGSASVVASLTSGTTGNSGVGLTIDSGGNLYGVCTSGGSSNDGTIFEIAAGTSTITVRGTFTGSNGQSPYGNVLVDSSGNIFGTTYQGGSSSDGTVFEIAAGTNTISTIYTFTGNNGSNPYGTLIEDANGNLYGTTYNGGSGGYGAVFEIASASGSTVATYSFSGSAGTHPRAGVTMDANGNLYGTTYIGGTGGYGTVFEIAAGTGTITTLANFNNSNGAYPFYGSMILDSQGNLYGTTQSGGIAGGIFEVVAGSNTINTLYTFPNPTGGYTPYGGVIMDSSGNLYGTTRSGGTNNYGVVFKLTRPGSTAITSQPSAVTAGTAQSLTVNLNLSGGSTDTTNQSPVTLSIASGPAGGSVYGALTQSAANGVATFNNLTFTKVGTYTLRVVSTGATYSTSTAITVTAGAGAQLVVTTQPSNAVAGASIGTVAVTIEDAYGNLATGDTSTVTLSGVSLTGTFTATPTNGVATFTGLAMTQAGTRAITATDGSLTSGTTNSITISAAAAAQCVFAQALSNTVAGQAISQFQVDVEDAYGNIASTSTAVVNLSAQTTLGGALTLSGQTSVQAVNGVATFSGSIIQQAGSAYLYAGNQSASLSTGQSSAFAVTPAAASYLALLSQPTSAVAGQSIGTLTLGVDDIYGNLVTTDTSVVSLWCAATLTGTTSTTAVGGIATFTGLSIQQAGNFLIAANNGVVPTVTTNSFTISAAAASQLVFTQQPTSATAGQSIGTVGVSVEDAFGNVVLTDTSTVDLTGNTLQGTASASAVAGVATFTGLSMLQAGMYTLSAGDGGLTSATSSAITIAPAAADHLGFDQQPTATNAGDLIGPVTVLVEDVYGNIVTGDNSSVTVSADAALGGTKTEAATSGVATFSDLVITAAGAHMLSAVDGSLGSTTSISFAVNHLAASALVFGQQPGTTIAGQTIGTFTVDVEDIYGNLVDDDNGAVTIATGTSIGGTTTVLTSGGEAVFTDLSINHAGSYLLSATRGGLTSGSSSLLINPAAASQLVIAQQPGDAAAGQSIGVAVVYVEDAFGNVVVTDSSAVSVSSSTTLGGTTTVAAVGGVATFSDLVVTQAGTHTVSANDGSLTAATSNSFVITAGAAAKLAIAEQPNGVATAGETIDAVIVAVEDAYGNIVTTDSSTVALSSGGALSGTTSVAAINGLATFNNVSFAAGGTYSLSATDGALAGATTNNVVVTGSTNETLINTLYEQLLNRPAERTSSGLYYWINRLENGATLTDVATGIASSVEYDTDVVTGIYHQYLNRAPDSAGLVFWVGQMQINSLSYESIRGYILGSDEFRTDVLSHYSDYVTGLYETLLSRAPDQTGFAAWTQLLGTGQSEAQRDAVAIGISTSKEQYEDFVQAKYEQFLNRAADANGLQQWTDELWNDGKPGGISDGQFIAQILSSSEYLHAHGLD
jgi:uncharacterized repeat protein (TIGR03803 family)